MTEASIVLLLKSTLGVASLAWGTVVLYQHHVLLGAAAVPELALMGYVLMVHSDRLRRKREKGIE